MFSAACILVELFLGQPLFCRWSMKQYMASYWRDVEVTVKGTCNVDINPDVALPRPTTFMPEQAGSISEISFTLQLR